MYRLFSLLTALFAAGPLFALGLTSSDVPSAADQQGAPLDVAVGIEIDQISFVDQKAENFGVVATLRFEWNDPTLAFSAEEFGREFRIMKPETFMEYAATIPAIVPAFVVQNQQSNRWINESLIVIWANGRTRYLEKSSLTLQAPYFNFTRFPLDRQKFYFEIVSVYPSSLVKYSVMEENSGLGTLLGEEEWKFGNVSMEVSSTTGISGLESAKVALAFEGSRHLMYYVIRIFLPMLILIVVSWSTFFLNEYRKRTEIAGANLLVFVAFNWVISDSLPKLGYVTFLDFILQWMFLVTGAIIVFNVGLSRLKQDGRESLARRLDNYVIKWIYPLGYSGVVLFAVYNFLILE